MERCFVQRWKVGGRKEEDEEKEEGFFRFNARLLHIHVLLCETHVKYRHDGMKTKKTKNVQCFSNGQSVHFPTTLCGGLPKPIVKGASLEYNVVYCIS